MPGRYDIRLLILGLICSAFLFASPAVYADDAHPDSPTPDLTRAIVGTVTAIDWVGSKLTVGDFTFNIPDGLTVRKGADEIDFEEVNVGDQVMVRYEEDSSGRVQVKTLVVQYNGEFAI